MRYEAYGWGLIGLCGGAAISLWLARPLDDPNWWRTSIAISLVGTVAGAGLLAWPGLVTAWQFLHNAKFHYRLRSPIERLMAWPHNAALASRVHHARTHVNFENLEKDHSFSVVLKLFNSTPFGLEVESVSGVTYYDQLLELKPVDIAWTTRGNTTAAPLDEFEVCFDQRVPADAIMRLNAAFASSKPVSIMLDSLRIFVRAQDTGERAQVRLWDGITCQILEHPVVIGKTVNAVAVASIGVGSLEVRR